MLTAGEHVKAVYRIIKENLAFCEATLFPDFRALLDTVFGDRIPSTVNLPWLLLPILTCEAFAGEALAEDMEQARHVAAALEIGRIAAGCLDEWQDRDTDEALWQTIGAERTVNLATGMLALSSLVLNRLGVLGTPATTTVDLQKEFYLCLLHMCEGQHADLGDDLALSDYEGVAGAKSGSLFRLGCRAGAMVAGAQADVVALYGDFGYNLGIVAQMWNDFQGLAGLRGKMDANHRRALPILATQALDQAAGERLPTTGQTYALVRLQVFHQRAADALARCPAPGRLSLFLDDYSTRRLVEKVMQDVASHEGRHAG